MKIDFKFVHYDDLLDSEVPQSVPDTMDRVAWEQLFHSLPQQQMELLVCLLLGMKPLEIVETLDYPNVGRFYNINAKLKQSYRKQKLLVF